MPDGGSWGYVPPTESERRAWQQAVDQMLKGSCHPALPAALAPHYERRWLGGDTGVCVLLETLDADGDGLVDRGWGTLAVARRPVREVHIHIAHPLFDIDTEHQGAAVFQATGGRTFLMAGAERNANYRASACQRDYWEADVAHDVGNFFHAAVEVLAPELEERDGVVIQLHGLGAQWCWGIDVFATWGGPWAPRVGSRLSLLADALARLRPNWRVRVTGQFPLCLFNGGSNVQGRLLNGVGPADVCSQAAAGPGERFMHVEQKRAFRETEAWVRAIEEVWPKRSPRPPRRVIRPGSLPESVR